MDINISGSVDSGFSGLIKMQPDETDHIELDLTANGQPKSIIGARVKMNIGGKEIDETSGIEIVDARQGKLVVTLSANDYPKGLTPFTIWALGQKSKVPLLSGYVEVG